MKAAYVVLAGGRGTRFGATVNKVYLPLAGRPVIAWSFLWAGQVPQIEVFVLVTHADDRAHAEQVLAAEVPDLPIEIVEGGATRHASEQAALNHLEPRVAGGAIDVIALHDGARPLAGSRLIAEVLAEAEATGGAIPAVDAGALWPSVTGSVVRVQTPQAFRARPLLAAYAAAARDGFEGTDTSATVERYARLPARAVRSDDSNLKITFADDVARAVEFLALDEAR